MPKAPTVDVIDGKCPECGVSLDTVNVQKHAIGHYGDTPLPGGHRSYVARARQAAILGRPIPEE